jgi:hypothetical protein
LGPCPWQGKLGDLEFWYHACPLTAAPKRKLGSVSGPVVVQEVLKEQNCCQTQLLSSPEDDSVGLGPPEEVAKESAGGTQEGGH